MSDAAERWWKFWPVASMLGGSSAIVLGRDVYGQGERRVIRWFHKWLYAGDRLLWKAKYRVIRKHRYHVVETGLPPGYYDEDERLLHAVMNIVVEHVERGCGGVEKLEEWTADLRAEPDPNAPDGLCTGQADHQASVIDVYRWWKVGRPADHARKAEMMRSLYDGRRMKWSEPEGKLGLRSFEGVEDMPGAPTPICTHEERWAFEDALRKKDQEMLHRVIDLRPGLWT